MKRKIIIIVTVLIVVFLCLLLFVFPKVAKEIHKMRMHTAYETLNTSLMISLSSYYRQNGRYPESVSELTEIEYCDGATPDLLKDFKYASDGNSCELSYFSAHFGKELKLYMVEGELKWEEDEKNGR